jgi:DNA-binding response OmpR family regulator
MTDQTDLRNRILLLETDEDVIRPLEVYFREQGMEFLVAGEAEAGLHQAVRARPDVILLASSLGGVDGLDLYQALRASPLTAHIPIMFITTHRDSARQNELLAAGRTT